MNDMSTIIVAADKAPDVPSPCDMKEVHILRSKIIGKCADLECWLVDRIQPYQSPSPSFSMKMKQFEEILDKHGTAFLNPKKLQSYLKAFLPFAVFRSELAHSKLSLVENRDGTTSIKIHNAICGSDVRTAKSIVLPYDELNIIWNEMHVAAQKITNYKYTPSP